MVMGNLTRDPEVRYTGKGTAVCDISIAVNRYHTDDNGNRQEETTYIDVTLWKRNAELAGQYLAKGRSVFIEGRMQMDSWDDKATGQKRTKLKVVAETMQFVGGTGQGGGGGGGSRPAGGQQSQRPNEAASYAASEPSGGSPADSGFDDDDDIPF